MRHEIPRDAVIRVIKQDSHDSSSSGRVPFTPGPSRAKPRTAAQPGRAMQKDSVGFPVFVELYTLAVHISGDLGSQAPDAT
jgi:hypothetical protein